MMVRCSVPVAVLLLFVLHADALSTKAVSSRRAAINWIGGAAGFLVCQSPAVAVPDLPDSFDVDSYLKTGLVSQPMGVSGQAGKSKPLTGVILRDGSEVSRDPRLGDVSAEILVESKDSANMPVLATYSSPWPLQTGSVYDVECRDPATGDGAFLAVTPTTGGKSINDLKDSFFVDSLISPTGRFSSYGPPTDVKIRSSTMDGRYKIIDMSFSTLSQSTQTELPRRARVRATIPEGATQAVMLVGTASALRWKKGSDKQIATVTDSFQAIAAPQSSLKLRAKERRGV